MDLDDFGMDFHGLRRFGDGVPCIWMISGSMFMNGDDFGTDFHGLERFWEGFAWIATIWGRILKDFADVGIIARAPSKAAGL